MKLSWGIHLQQGTRPIRALLGKLDVHPVSPAPAAAAESQADQSHRLSDFLSGLIC